MLKALIPTTPIPLAESNSAALENPAVARCAEVWETTYQSVFAKTKSRVDAKSAADLAFYRAMPPLAGYQNICDFIACIAYAMLSKIIWDDSASKLLYAAQVALSTIPQQSKIQTRK